jgi:hypothetical protein
MEFALLFVLFREFFFRRSFLIFVRLEKREVYLLKGGLKMQM